MVIGNEMSELHKHIHPSVLPEEYGGDLPPSDSKEALAKLLETDAEWDKESRYGFRVPQEIRCEDGQDLVPVAKEEPCAA